MADLKLVGAVAIKIRPDASGFKKETQAKVDEQLKGVEGQIKIKGDTTQAKLDAEKAKVEIEKKEINLKVGLDYDSVRAAQARLDQLLKKHKEITVDLNDKGSIDRAQAKLDKMMKKAKVEMTYVQDEKGYQSILDKIAKIRREKLEKQIKFKTDDASLDKAEAKIRAKLAKITPSVIRETLKINFDTDRTTLAASIAEIDKELAKRRVATIDVDMDEESLNTARNILQSAMNRTPVEVKFTPDETGYREVLAKIDSIRRQRAEVTVDLNLSDAELEAKRQEIAAKLRGLTMDFKVELNRTSLMEAERDARKLKDKIDDMKASIEINDKGTLSVAAHLAYIARDRIVNYFVHVNERSVAVAEGTLKSLAGLNVLHEATSFLENLFTKFDEIALKAGAVSTAIGSIADVAIFAGTAVFRVGEGVLQSIGLLAAAPALATAAAASIFVYTAAFDNFVNAFSTDAKKQAKAMAALPPIAKATVNAIRGLYQEIQKPVQDAFWDRMGTSLQDSIDHLIPTLKTGLVGLAPSIGAFTAGVLDSFNKMALSGDLDAMFKNLAGFFDNLSKASEPFFDGFNQFGLKGSELLPRFGKWLADLATRFDNWATKAAAAGDIVKWINQGVDALQQMWKVGGDVIDIFKAITRAAGLAGTGGLGVFQQNLRNTADKMLAEPWQSKAALIFEGARAGATKLNTGFHDLTGTIGNAAGTFSNFLRLLGSIGGAVLTDLSKAIGVKNFQDGVTTALGGLLKLTHDLQPAFHSLGDLIGNLEKIAGSAFSNMGGSISSLFGLVDQVVSKIAGNLALVVPKLTNSISGLFVAFTPSILFLADVVNNILGLLAKIPNSFILVSVAASAFFALRALSSKFYESLSGTKTFKDMESNWLTQQVAAGNTVEKYKLVNGELQKFTAPVGKFDALATGFATMGASIDGYRDHLQKMNDLARVDGLSPLRANMMTTGTVIMDGIRNIGTGLANAGKGLLSALGGPWGIAIAGASAAIGFFAQQQSEAKSRVDAYTATLDLNTGAITRNTRELAGKNLIDEGGWWNDVFRGAKKIQDILPGLGMDFKNTFDIVSNGGPAFDDLMGKLKLMPGTTGDGTKSVQLFKDAFHLTDDQVNKFGKDIPYVVTRLQTMRDEVGNGQTNFQLLNGTVDKGAQRLKDFNDAMGKYNDSTQTADSRTRALKDAIDLLNGKQLDVEDAQQRVNQSMLTINGSMQAFTETVGDQTVTTMRRVGGAFYDAQGKVKDFTGVIDKNTGAINTANEVGQTLRTDLKATTEDVRATATGMKDAHKPIQDIAAYLDTARQQFINMGTAAGLNGDDVAAAYDHMMGANPKELITLIEAKGVEDANTKVLNFQGTLAEIDGKKAVATIAGDDKILGQKLGDSYDSLSEFSKVVATATADLNPDEADAVRKRLTLDLEALAESNPTVKANMDPKLLNDALKITNADLDNLKKQRPSPIVDAQIEEARQKLQTIQTMIDNLTPRRVLSVETVYTESGPKPAGYVVRNGVVAYTDADGGIHRNNARVFANGGILAKYFAGGGFENHVAQIARPGVIPRIWAEKETQGEAYIPYAQSKRPRSVSILAQVAKDFGYQLTKATAAFSSGGTSGPAVPSTSTSASVHIGALYTNDPDGAVRKLRQAQQDALAVHGITR